MSEDVKKRKIKPAAWFLLVIVAVLIIMIGGRIWWEADPSTPMRMAFTPSTDFNADSPLPAPDYASADAWFIRDSAADTKDNTYARMGVGGSDVALASAPQVDVFYIHPTSGFDNKRWNAAFDDVKANARTDTLAMKHHVSAFNGHANLFAPKYRQANFGAFFETPPKNNLQAFILAYTDVVKAFTYYMEHLNGGRPFIIASHSQGTMHAIPMIMQKIKGTPAADRMVAAYLVGWPISIEADLPALGFPACQTANDTGCLISWQAFGKDGDAKMLKNFMDSTPGFTGKPRAGTLMLCTNPLNWTIGGTADIAAHKGAMELYIDNKPLPPVSQDRFGAACTADGVLKIDRLLKGNVWEQYQMAGMNMHAYDYNLFYMNLRDNIQARIQSFMSK